MTLTISICTNDDHGNNTGKVCAVQLDDALELRWEEMGREPRYSLSNGILRFSRNRFRYLGFTTWYGNWCWTGVTMDDEEAARFLNYLSQDERWHCEGGWCDLSDAYAEGKVTPEMLAAEGLSR